MNDIDKQIAHHLPAARRGDRESFNALVSATQAMVSSLALAVVRDVHLSEDVAQEAYLKTWQRMHHLNNAGSFLPWLRQITRNLARDHLRRRIRRPGDVAYGKDVELQVDLAGPGHCSSEDRAIEDEQDRLITETLEELPAESREVLTLFYREGRSSRQVALLLGLSDSAVRKRLERARGLLRSGVESRLGCALRSSAPGMAFTAAIGSMLASASPPAAASATLGIGAKGTAKLAAMTGLGAIAGMAGGIAGVVLGLRPAIRSSSDPEELEGLLRIRRLGVLTVVLAVAGLVVSAFIPGWYAPTAVFVVFIAALGWQQMVMIPKVLAARHARERRVDPKAAQRQLRQRRLAWLGMIVGALSGGAGLIAGLVSTGRIALG
ncbi:MAG: sigma-70 family RNA polymerase sigma factor [Gammaproteobacteria bacterium]|jgi:RNA polymerase sigma factor (sigma-70 family)|nr:sigma-70 family RNA polymerase sigma factor [Gammaproteobacteria bacterium]